MVAFLSPEWIRQLDEAARASSGMREGADDSPLVVEQRVTGTPWGEVVYHAVLGADSRVEVGPGDSAHVVFLTDYETALRLHAGVLNAQDAIAAGRLKVRGHVDVLVRRADALHTLGDMFRGVRARTETPPP